MTEFQKLIFQAGCKAFHSKTPDLLVNHTRMSVTVGEYGCIRITRDATGGFDVIGEEHEGKTQHFWVSDTNVVWGVKLEAPIQGDRLGPATAGKSQQDLYSSASVEEAVYPKTEPDREYIKEELDFAKSVLEPEAPVKKKAGRPKKNV